MSNMIKIIPATLPVGYCWPSDPQQYVNDLAAYGLSAELTFDTTNTYFNVGAVAPAADYRVYPWLRKAGDYLDGMFWWSSTYSAWVKPNPAPPSGLERRLYVGTTVQLETYDGGDTGTAGVASGPMWQVDTDFAAKFLVGPGTFAASGTLSVAGSTTDTGVSGEDKHVLTEDELPAHTHSVELPNDIASSDTLQSLAIQGDGTAETSFESAATGGGLSHNNLPPMQGVYVIKRTARLYYKVTA